MWRGWISFRPAGGSLSERRDHTQSLGARRPVSAGAHPRRSGLRANRAEFGQWPSDPGAPLGTGPDQGAPAPLGRTASNAGAMAEQAQGQGDGPWRPAGRTIHIPEGPPVPPLSLRRAGGNRRRMYACCETRAMTWATWTERQPRRAGARGPEGGAGGGAPGNSLSGSPGWSGARFPILEGRAPGPVEVLRQPIFA